MQTRKQAEEVLSARKDVPFSVKFYPGTFHGACLMSLTSKSMQWEQNGDVHKFRAWAMGWEAVPCVAHSRSSTAGQISPVMLVMPTWRWFMLRA